MTSSPLLISCLWHSNLAPIVWHWPRHNGAPICHNLIARTHMPHKQSTPNGIPICHNNMAAQLMWPPNSPTHICAWTKRPNWFSAHYLWPNSPAHTYARTKHNNWFSIAYRLLIAHHSNLPQQTYGPLLISYLWNSDPHILSGEFRWHLN